VAPQARKANLRKTLNFTEIQGFFLSPDRQKKRFGATKKTK
jgi:hypothetical protein